MLNIYYIHSKICEAIVFAENSPHGISPDAIIYGRNYRGPFFKNSITLYEDQIFEELHLLAYGKIISRFFLKLPPGDVRIIIPHFANAIFYLLASHHRVKEVYYIEEGDLSYDDNLSLESSLHLMSSENSNVSRILCELGFEISGYSLFPDFKRGWFYDAFQKYSGTIVSNDLALSDFGGSRFVVKLKNKIVFENNSAIILLSDINDLAHKLKGLICANGIAVEFDNLKDVLLMVVRQKFIHECKRLQSLGLVIYYKPHPSLNDGDLSSIVKDSGVNAKCWYEAGLDQLSYGYDISNLNFTCLSSVGNTSAERYAIIAGKDCNSINIISDNEIFTVALGHIMNAMQASK